jgi:hypothetical protein
MVSGTRRVGAVTISIILTFRTTFKLVLNIEIPDVQVCDLCEKVGIYTDVDVRANVSFTRIIYLRYVLFC